MAGEWICPECTSVWPAVYGVDRNICEICEKELST